MVKHGVSQLSNTKKRKTTDSTSSNSNGLWLASIPPPSENNASSAGNNSIVAYSSKHLCPPPTEKEKNTVDTNEGTNTADPPTSSPSKTRSFVWLHFEKIKNSDGKETSRVRCLWCGKNYQGGSAMGTSGLRKHLRVTCKKFPHKQQLIDAEIKKDKSQKTLTFLKSINTESPKIGTWCFDQEVCRKALVEMIIKDELPFRFVEREGFREFIQVALKKRLLKKNVFILDGDAFHMRYFAHILQLIVKDGLQISQVSIKKIRDVVKYIRSSPQRMDLFKKACELANLKNKSSLQLDCLTRWNSTYLMLDCALGYQKAFDMLEDIDSKFLADSGDDLPSEVDWTKAKVLIKFLKKFYDATCKLSGTLYSTSNLYFPEVIKILKELDTSKIIKDSELSQMTIEMRGKFDQYWGSLDKMNVMLFVAVVLDPRCKLKYLKAKYTIYYGEDEAKNLEKMVKTALELMVDEYKIIEDQLHMGEVVGSSEKSAYDSGPSEMETEEEIDEFFLEEEAQQNLSKISELDRYFEEFTEKFTIDFDILAWWKVNSVRYPILSKVARDVLAIQASTVASESAFSTGGRTLDQYRSSLLPTTAEKLFKILRLVNHLCQD
ncbi:zinc finger BED domain-containing protein RICESLEEPER 2-like [Ricinus communis]|uniref:zinc finger BED domain-containing protein RICESLEEPER 2-like n=1 Tax=Ricinus communis TaxID=3988 RepID=UPI00201A619A|nr:zinc finger BED domain-containing protein RICESLEEPER 2-like [Ricinus communis]